MTENNKTLGLNSLNPEQELLIGTLKNYSKDPKDKKWFDLVTRLILNDNIDFEIPCIIVHINKGRPRLISVKDFVNAKIKSKNTGDKERKYFEEIKISMNKRPIDKFIENMGELNVDFKDIIEEYKYLELNLKEKITVNNTRIALFDFLKEKIETEKTFIKKIRYDDLRIAFEEIDEEKKNISK